MQVVSIVGARPQFVKLAPVAEAFAGTDHEHHVIHTGQHYDFEMSEAFFHELDIPEPRWNLGIGSGSHGQQTGAMLPAIEELLDEHRPDWVLVYGDTNSTLAGAIAAVKLHLPVAHVEAGLRSFNRRMPEEHNRVLTDHASDLLLAPTQTAMEHLATEGLAERSVLVGDVMADVLATVRKKVEQEPPPRPEPVAGVDDYLVATIHRAENTDDPERLRAVVEALAGLPMPVLLLAHPRLRDRAFAHGIDLEQGAIRLHDPLPYGSMVSAVLKSKGVVTDSGGLQKEAFLLGVPCTTLRDETEWPETFGGRANVLARDLDSLAELVVRVPDHTDDGTPFGDGQAAGAIVAALIGT